MRIQELLEKTEKAAPGKKIKRDAFLYMAPQGDEKEFAQCGTCKLFIPGSERCAILGPSVHVPAEASCGLYVHGEPSNDQDAVAIYKPSEVGLVKREVRCENCRAFESGTCRLFKNLNEQMPDVFDLDEKVDEYGCCNGQLPK